jgi:hypothetical protein
VKRLQVGSAQTTEDSSLRMQVMLCNPLQYVDSRHRWHDLFRKEPRFGLLGRNTEVGQRGYRTRLISVPKDFSFTAAMYS